MGERVGGYQLFEPLRPCRTPLRVHLQWVWPGVCGCVCESGSGVAGAYGCTCNNNNIICSRYGWVCAGGYVCVCVCVCARVVCVVCVCVGSRIGAAGVKGARVRVMVS